MVLAEFHRGLDANNVPENARFAVGAICECGPLQSPVLGRRRETSRVGRTHRDWPNFDSPCFVIASKRCRNSSSEMSSCLVATSQTCPNGSVTVPRRAIELVCDRHCCFCPGYR